MQVCVVAFHAVTRETMGQWVISHYLLPDIGDRWFDPATQKVYSVTHRIFDWSQHAEQDGEEYPLVALSLIEQEQMPLSVEFYTRVQQFIERYRPALEKLSDDER